MTIQEILAIAGVIEQLVRAGQMTVKDVRAMLANNGATDEQLADLDAALSAAIQRREET